jgi:hypothetical protein
MDRWVDEWMDEWTDRWMDALPTSITPITFSWCLLTKCGGNYIFQGLMPSLWHFSLTTENWCSQPHLPIISLLLIPALKQPFKKRTDYNMHRYSVLNTSRGLNNASWIESNHFNSIPRTLTMYPNFTHTIFLNKIPFSPVEQNRGPRYEATQL